MAAPTAGLVFMHGSGDSGAGVREWLDHASGGFFERKLSAAGVKCVYPSARPRPYTLNGGFPQAVWFDRVAMAYDAPEDKEGVRQSMSQVEEDIDGLVKAGIPLERIAVAGMSMGGCMALHVAYRGKHAGKLAAAASLSTFLPKDSELDEAAKHIFQGSGALRPAPLFMAHGTADGMINPAWARSTRDRLQGAGVAAPSEVVMFEGLGHDMCQEELAQLADFLIRHLAD
eukprot:gb/GFBE01012130.1/.p1 GENE.gb/GFBE01012130.1/~~gb/GFBE01012130.1/.p1  ORF type:complete len:229 (+),score=43.87 gb/GFBE01012130.1/:1-687(+)